VSRRSIIVQQTAFYLAEQAQAQSANSSSVAANESSTVNGAAFTAVASANFAAPAISLTTGKRFRVSANFSGTASAVDLLATVTLQRDGVNISNSATMVVSAGHATAAIFCALSVIDTPSAGSHTYSINIVMASGTITIPVNQINITVEEKN
jgi:hypothetical protein